MLSNRRVETNAPTRRKRKNRKITVDLAGDFTNGRQIVYVKLPNSGQGYLWNLCILYSLAFILAAF